MRLPWIAAAVAVGAAVGLALAALQSPDYRATVSFVVAPSLRSTDSGVPTLTQTAAQLVRTPSVAQNVVDALALHQSADALLSEISVRTQPGTAIVRVSVRRHTALDARRVAQQVLVVFEGLANSRLGRPGSGQAVAVWDAAGDNETRDGRPYAAYALGGGSAALLVALLAAFAPLRRPRRVKPAPIRSEPRPGPPLARAAVVVAAEPVAEPEPPKPATPLSPAALGMVAEMERRASAEPDPDRREELELYLEQLRPFAGPDGLLPANLIGLAEDVFGEL